MTLLVDDQQDPNDGNNLPEVTLKKFKAEPASIQPFGASLLSWAVEGKGFTVKLDGVEVAKVGEKVVRPSSDRIYRLTAVIQGGVQYLGSVAVHVLTQECESFNAIVNPQQFLVVQLKQQVEQHPPFHLVSVLGHTFLPVVTFLPGRIRFDLFLGVDVEGPFSVGVEIGASFGLRATEGTIVATDPEVDIDVSVNSWNPIADEIVEYVVNQNTADAKDFVRNKIIQGLAELINALALLSPPVSKRILRVEIDEGELGSGLILVTKCPDRLLRGLAAISGTKSDTSSETST
jgi:hypothetical protein